MSDTGRRVAIAVFVEVHDESADDRDAAHRAEMGLEAALAGQATLEYTGRQWHIHVANADSKFVPCDVNLTVHKVMEVGMAIGNGLIWTHVTGQAFPREESDDDA